MFNTLEIDWYIENMIDENAYLQALYDFESNEPNEISFKAGDILKVRFLSFTDYQIIRLEIVVVQFEGQLSSKSGLVQWDGRI